MNEADARAFFDENPHLSGTIAAVNGVDANGEGDAALITYDIFVNAPGGMFRFNGVTPNQWRPPAGTAWVAGRKNQPIVVTKIGPAYTFQVIGENYATTEDCTPAAQAQTGAPS